jgi:hypothetical protein
MRAAGDGPDGARLRGVIVALWRAGLQISEALALNETDLHPERGAYRPCRHAQFARPASNRRAVALNFVRSP